MPTIYLVQEHWAVRWRRLKEETPYMDYCEPSLIDGYPDPQQGTPVRAFFDLGRAEEFCRTLEQSYRETLNPFECWNGYVLDELTSFDAGRFHDWLLDASIDAPEETDDLEVWSTWWQNAGAKLPADKRTRVWEALDKVRFYHVLAFPEEEQPS